METEYRMGSESHITDDVVGSSVDGVGVNNSYADGRIDNLPEFAAGVAGAALVLVVAFKFIASKAVGGYDRFLKEVNDEFGSQSD